MYELRYAKSVDKELRKLAKNKSFAGIINKIQQLANEPKPKGSIKIKGSEDMYRLRSGDYRIIYSIQDLQLVVLVIRVGHRKDIYDNL